MVCWLCGVGTRDGAVLLEQAPGVMACVAHNLEVTDPEVLATAELLNQVLVAAG